MSSNAESLAAAVTARREELDRTQLDVWQAGGPSNTTLTEIENGRLKTLTRTTARRLDIGLRWVPGSARVVWNGGEPTPFPELNSRYEELEAEIRKADLNPETKAYILRVLEEQEERRANGERGTA